MKYLWLLWLPLLYLPSLSLTGATDFGTLKLSNYFIGPYIILVFLRTQDNWHRRLAPPQKLYIHYITPLLLAFIWWTFLATITISFRFNYPDTYYVTFGLYKVAKLGLYGIAAILTTVALGKADKTEYQGFLWAFLLCGILVGGGLFLTGNGNASGFTDSAPDSEALFQDNGISALLSMPIVFFIGMLVTNQGTKSWRVVTSVALILIILGFVSARGRGGWVAAIIALLFVAAQINIKQTIRAVVIAVILISFAYNNNSTFRSEVDKTLQPNKSTYLEERGLGLDDGGRFGIFDNQFSLIFKEPVFGRGFFHRGASSGIYGAGSHNFYLQMFLETGIPGGLLVLLILGQMWTSASTEHVKRLKLDIPIKAGILAGVIAANTGEYFYLPLHCHWHSLHCYHRLI